MTDPSPPRRVPKYRRHKPTGQAVVTLSGKDHYLGTFGTAQSQERYARLVAEWLQRGRQTRPTNSGAASGGLTVNEVILAYLRHTDEYYRDSPKEREKVRLSLRPLRTLYGRTDSAAFGPLALKAVREEMGRTLARTTVNHRVAVIKRMFKWAVGSELVPPAVFEGLRAVEGLKKGRTQARETEAVRPVPDGHVEAVLPLVSRHVGGMIRVQHLTGARPGEVCDMRRADIDVSGRVWVYRPRQHKNLHRGHAREIYLGPRAQEVLREFFQPDMDAILFSPREAMAERSRERRAKRKTKVQASQADRRVTEPKKVPGQRYTTNSYRHAVAVACKRAGVPSWHPNQLRHNAGTNLRKEFGVELARIILGHKTAFTTEIYAETDRDQAMAVMAKIG
jgi:integrase